MLTSRDAGGQGHTGRRDIGVAVGLPEPYGGLLQSWRKRLGDLNAAGIPPHVTLLPPTSLAEHVLPEVEEHLASVAAAEQPFTMLLRGSGSFRPVSPVVFVALAEGAADCDRVQAAVRSGPLRRELGFPYHPHVTVAHDLTAEALDRASSALAGFEARFTVWGFTMFEQDREGVWRPQRDFPFGAGGRPGPVPSPKGVSDTARG